jgi:hypothetical protein
MIISLQQLKATNKQLGISTNAWFRKRNKITNDSWKKIIKPALLNAENSIYQVLRSQTATDWQIQNASRIMAQIQPIINKFDTAFQFGVSESQNVIAHASGTWVDRSLKTTGLIQPINPVIGEELIAALKPLSQVFVQAFSKDMAKIISTEINVGLINGESVQKVAGNLREKFGIDSKRIKTLEAKKKLLNTQLSKGEISKAKFDKLMKPINKGLESGSMMSYARAERIARTEMNRASSFANWQRGLDVADTNPDARKIWVSSNKPNLREDHKATEIQSKADPPKINQPFNVAGHEAMYPRDPALPVGEVVGCGCTMVYINKTDLTGIQNLEIKRPAA